LSTLSRLTTWSSGDVLTADDLNAEIDNIVNDYNGSITNANISASAAIAISKLATINESDVTFSGSGHGHTGTTDGKIITINRGFTWGIVGTLAVADEQGMKYPIPQAMTVTNLRAKTTSGTATIRIQTDTTDIDASASITSTLGNITSFDSTTLTAGQVLTLDITAVSSGVDLYAILETTQP
jgi:hypothetical protein